MDKNLLKEIALEQDHKLQSLATGTKREKLDGLSAYFSLPQAVIISGIRRCGKSTLLNQIIKKYYPDSSYFFSFEDERLINFSVEEFNDLYEILIELFGEKRVFFFDEIQNVPQWERFVRRMQDDGFKFYITGSNASLLSKEFGTKLTGRAIVTELYPFSFKEFLLFKGQEMKAGGLSLTKSRGAIKKHFHDYLVNGGMPEYLKSSDPIVLKRMYEDILYRDIAVRHEIKDVKALRELCLYLLSNMASLFTYNNLKVMLQLGSVNTVRSYINFLEDSYLMFTLTRFSYSLKKQYFAPRKIYCIDNGLVGAVAFQFSKNKGKFLENLVFMELKRRGSELYYYKTEHDREVDFVIRKGNAITDLIQVTENLTAEKTRAREVQALTEAMGELKMDRALLLTFENEEVIETEKGKITVKPVYKWLLE